MYSSKLMADGKQWTTHNLNVVAANGEALRWDP